MLVTLVGDQQQNRRNPSLHTTDIKVTNHTADTCAEKNYDKNITASKRTKTARMKTKCCCNY